VDSAIVRFEKSAEKLNQENKRKFFQLIKFGFSAKRKMLKNNLSAGFRSEAKEIENIIVSAGFCSGVRAQELDVDDWIKLLNFF
jgi:16S rRNA (adenine1518-N6/adenine1519-N6)-dimethyltransferase